VTVPEDQLAAQMKLRSRSFEGFALDYDRHRPTYPQTLFDAIAARLSLPDDVRVADLGAGTGKAARQMARRGWHVTAIEPGEGMLDVLRARAQAEGLNIDARLASAEVTGLPDASVDLVTAAQAFHWFDKARAVPEMARIVRPGGGVAVFWNARADDRSEFLDGHMNVVARYVPEEHIDRRPKDDATTTREDLSQGGYFDVDKRLTLQHEVRMTVEEFVEYAFTASYIRLFVAAEKQQSLRTDLREQAARYVDEESLVTVALDVDAYIAQRTEVSVDGQ
jgi:SAM-dependent methyltransferase